MAILLANGLILMFARQTRLLRIKSEIALNFIGCRKGYVLHFVFDFQPFRDIQPSSINGQLLSDKMFKVKIALNRG